MPDAVTVLLADDSEDDVLLIKRAFGSAKIGVPLHVVASGDEAIGYLSGTGKYSDRAQFPLPSLFLLDLNMPGTDGFEVLRWLRHQPGLQAMRALVLTSSERIWDVNRAYQLGANSFLVKPMDFHDLVALTRVIQDFWLTRSKAPDTAVRVVTSPPPVSSIAPQSQA